MTKSELLRKMAAYIRKHGFSPKFEQSEGSKRGCFCHAWGQVRPSRGGPSVLIGGPLQELVGGCYSESLLRRAGWTGPEVTADAAAACEIAADLCEGE